MSDVVLARIGESSALILVVLTFFVLFAVFIAFFLRIEKILSERSSVRSRTIGMKSNSRKHRET